VRKVPEEEKKEKLEVTILSRREYTTYPKLKQPVVNIDITYVYKDLPPRTITIAKEEYTKEKEKAAIKADLEKLLKEKPETLEI